MSEMKELRDLLQEVIKEIAVNEVHLSNKVEKLDLSEQLTAMESKLNEKINKLSYRWYALSGIIGGGTGYFF